MSRPDPPYPAEPGYHWEAVEQSPDWRAVNDEVDADKRCRYTAGPNTARTHCTHTAVAKLFRRGKRSSWWHYCAEHLYGRWVENGKVMGWRLVEDADGTAP